MFRHPIETKVVSGGRIGQGVAIGLTILQKVKLPARKNEGGYDDQAFAGDLAGPLFTAGRLKNQYRAALAQREQAKISFEKAVTGAFGEVSISLSAHQELAEAYRKQMASADAYRESIRLATIRYDSGLASYFEIIDAEIQAYPADTATVTYDLGRKVALVNLYRALGGGWNLTDAQWMSSVVTPAVTPTPAP